MFPIPDIFISLNDWLIYLFIEKYVFHYTMIGQQKWNSQKWEVNYDIHVNVTNLDYLNHIQ